MVICGTAAADTTMSNDAVSVSPSSSSTVIVTVCVPVASGVPESVLPEIDIHEGSPETVYASVPSPPVAASNVREKAIPTVAV